VLTLRSKRSHHRHYARRPRERPALRLFRPQPFCSLSPPGGYVVRVQAVGLLFGRGLGRSAFAIREHLERVAVGHDPDAHIVTSLPRSGTLRAARLLAEIGDARGRFPTADSLACLAGVAPSTRQSGKVKSVTFRWGANKELRDAVCDFAGGSRHANPWAAHLYAKARARGHDHPHAVRILARAWVHIIWRAWQDNVGYDPIKHGALQALLTSTTEKRPKRRRVDTGQLIPGDPALTIGCVIKGGEATT
jgi:hypothetical protein